MAEWLHATTFGLERSTTTRVRCLELGHSMIQDRQTLRWRFQLWCGYFAKVRPGECVSSVVPTLVCVECCGMCRNRMLQ